MVSSASGAGWRSRWTFRQSPYRRPSTTQAGSDRQRFRITHPFHPLKGEEYELVGFAHTWGEHRVFFRKQADQRVYSLPASWTDVEEPDPFVVMSAGRSLFRPDGFARPGGSTRESAPAETAPSCKANYAGTVRRILPGCSIVLVSVAPESVSLPPIRR